MTSSFKINENFVLVLDIMARCRRPWFLFILDKETRGLSSHELGADVEQDIINALTQEIEIVELLPVAIETDNSIYFSGRSLHEWLCSRGIEHRRPAVGKPHYNSLAERLIRQQCDDRVGQ